MSCILFSGGGVITNKTGGFSAACCSALSSKKHFLSEAVFLVPVQNVSQTSVRGTQCPVTDWRDKTVWEDAARFDTSHITLQNLNEPNRP